MYPETIKIELLQEDFEESSYISNEDCALARGIKRGFEKDPSMKSLEGFTMVGGSIVYLFPGCSKIDIEKSLNYSILDFKKIVDIYWKDFTPEFPFIVTLRKA